MNRTRFNVANARTERVHQLAARPDGVSASEVVDAITIAPTSVQYVLAKAKQVHGLVRVRRPGTRGYRWFANAAQAAAWAARADTTARNGYPTPSAATSRTTVRPDRTPIDVPPVPGWGGPPVRRRGSDDWRRCAHVVLGHRQPGASQ